MIIGIDIGGTTTDIVGLKDGIIISPLTVKADDPITSAAGALGKFLETINISLSEIKKISATGVGARKVKNNLFGIPVMEVDEFQAIGTAGSFLSGLNKAVVVSMGTGTAVVTVNGSKIAHWGGSGVGGGTLIGLAGKCLISRV
jgi:type II pantothenate kinase